uniref:Plant lipid transfer/seed storage/trypsin-alpha amylase inhibitor n=1 Tax=Rhabditophanes sp. KR3021 TaxID=114890 RepID=A0AC35U968_9BILA
MKVILLILFIFYINAQSPEMEALQNAVSKQEANKVELYKESDGALLTCVTQFYGPAMLRSSPIPPTNTICKPQVPCANITGTISNQDFGISSCADILSTLDPTVAISYKNICSNIPISIPQIKIDVTVCFCITDKCNLLSNAPTTSPTSAPIITTTKGTGTKYLSALTTISSIISYLFILNH